ncbi:MAG: hypothetical protein MUF49_20400 [Oculatellaceae cyanobacterium Prado106]|nr:hypothetical protein [Oculatellaceae cyanobacterium Prado106]
MTKFMIFFERLLHAFRVVGGSFASKFLRYLFNQGKGSSSRLHQTLSTSQSSLGYSSRVLIQPIALKLSKPQFFIEGASEEKYLEMLANYGSHSTPLSGVISANHVNVSLPVGMHLHHGKVIEEALLGTEVLANPKYSPFAQF